MNEINTKQIIVVRGKRICSVKVLDGRWLQWLGMALEVLKRINAVE
jgi:hypothetical protein